MAWRATAVVVGTVSWAVFALPKATEVGMPGPVGLRRAGPQRERR